MNTEFNYMLLGRLIEDCKYYLGNGNRNDRDLWAGSPKAQIEKMRELWQGFEIKPEWCSLEEIERYAIQMLNDKNL